MKHIYHITHINNLPSIIQHDGLFCDTLTSSYGLTPLGIAHQHIKQRRACREVPVAARGTLSDYVPFYFAPRSPMLYAIHKHQVKGYNGGQQDILHLVATIQRVSSSGLSFAFTDGHAEVKMSRFFEHLSHLVMTKKYWNDTQQDTDRKRRRQAEFLIYQRVPWSLIDTIGVMHARIGAQVQTILQATNHRPQVVVQQAWYY